jgi:hypothetical protein
MNDNHKLWQFVCEASRNLALATGSHFDTYQQRVERHAVARPLVGVWSAAGNLVDIASRSRAAGGSATAILAVARLAKDHPFHG